MRRAQGRAPGAEGTKGIGPGDEKKKGGGMRHVGISDNIFYFLIVLYYSCFSYIRTVSRSREI